MAQLKRLDQSFECDYKINVESEKLLEGFGKHVTQIHRIDYGKESLIISIANELNKK